MWLCACVRYWPGEPCMQMANNSGAPSISHKQSWRCWRRTRDKASSKSAEKSRQIISPQITAQPINGWRKIFDFPTRSSGFPMWMVSIDPWSARSCSTTCSARFSGYISMPTRFSRKWLLSKRALSKITLELQLKDLFKSSWYPWHPWTTDVVFLNHTAFSAKWLRNIFNSEQTTSYFHTWISVWNSYGIKGLWNTNYS